MLEASGPDPAARALPRRLTPGGRHGDWYPVTPAYVALDVDGTLVTDAEVPDDAVLAAIGRLTRLGVRVGLATGRMAAANGPLLATGVFTGPHVFHNGAVVRDGEGHDRVVRGLDDAAVEHVLTFGRSRDDVSIEIYVAETYLSDRHDPRSAPHHELLRLAPSGTIRSVSDLGGREVVKAVVVCFSVEASVATVAAVTALGLAAGPAASPATPGLRYVNVTSRGVDKGSGVRIAAELIGVGLHRSAAIGDETNDVPVLRLVGTAIAMGDSSAEVRRHAHLVAPCFDDSGTTTALDALADLVSEQPAQREPGTW